MKLPKGLLFALTCAFFATGWIAGAALAADRHSDDKKPEAPQLVRLVLEWGKGNDALRGGELACFDQTTDDRVTEILRDQSRPAAWGVIRFNTTVSEELSNSHFTPVMWVVLDVNHKPVVYFGDGGRIYVDPKTQGTPGNNFATDAKRLLEWEMRSDGGMVLNGLGCDNSSDMSKCYGEKFAKMALWLKQATRDIIVCGFATEKRVHEHSGIFP